jgi:serine protease Do
MQKRNIIVLLCFGTMIVIIVVNREPSKAASVAVGINAGATARRAAPDPVQASPAAAAPIRGIQDDLGWVVSAVRPAVVNNSVTTEMANHRHPAGMQLLDPFPSRTGWVGSGVIIDPGGYVLTNRQVAGEANEFRITLFRGGQNSFSAVRVAADPQSDLVLLKLPFGGKLPFAVLGNSAGVSTGDIVVALGSSFGLAETVTHGIVSANRREVTIGNRRFTNVIQTDASINQGNCGGPLVNIKAEVIGLNMAIYSTDSSFSGIGFAISSNQAREFVSRALGRAP